MLAVFSLMVCLVGLNNLASAAGLSGIVKFSAGKTTYSLGGVNVKMDAAPYVKDDRIFVPVRYLADALNLKTRWNQANKQVTVQNTLTTITITVGSKKLTSVSQVIDKGKSYATVVQMDAAPELKGGRVFLPASWIATAFGYSVRYLPNEQAIAVMPKMPD